ncbi:MAG: diacylglycerol kinase [Planctomycetaceae bacterium]|nr:diacylglycerol kinase [Planctomycetaceae bacterium]
MSDRFASRPPAVLTETEGDPPLSSFRNRRAPWRQRLVEAERGFVQGFRSDSAFFVYFFAGLICVTAGLVLGLGMVEWLLLTVALTLVFISELFHQMAKVVFESLPMVNISTMRKTLRLGMAAVVVSIGGAAIIVCTLFGRRIAELLAG